MLSVATVAAVKMMVALAGPFRCGTSAMSHRHQGMRLSAHIHHSSGRRCRIPARTNAASRASTPGGLHGQPPHQAAGTSGASNSASHPIRHASIGYQAASGSGATTATASSRCPSVGGSWFVVIGRVRDACMLATPCTVPALTTHIASVASPSAT